MSAWKRALICPYSLALDGSRTQRYRPAPQMWVMSVSAFIATYFERRNGIRNRPRQFLVDKFRALSLLGGGALTEESLRLALRVRTSVSAGNRSIVRVGRALDRDRCDSRSVVTNLKHCACSKLIIRRRAIDVRGPRRTQVQQRTGIFAVLPEYAANSLHPDEPIVIRLR